MKPSVSLSAEDVVPRPQHWTHIKRVGLPSRSEGLQQKT